MKKLFIFMILFIGMVSFSETKKAPNPKVVITIVNDNYENPILRGVERSGILSKAFMLGDLLTFNYKNDNRKYAENLLKEIWEINKGLPDKFTFIIEENEEDTLLEVLKEIKRYKHYKGNVEVIEISSKENEKIRNYTDKNGWTYNQYDDLSELPGEVEVSGEKYNKNEFIAGMLLGKYSIFKK